MDVVFQALQQFFSQYVVALAALIIAAVWAIWRLATRFQSMNDKVEGIDSLPCARHNSRLDSHDAQISDTRALLGRMEGQLELLVQNTIEKTGNKIRKKSGVAYSAKHSPRKLNEFGEKLLKDCGGADFLKANMSFFISKIEQLQPKTALDVEDMALAVLQMHTNEDMFIPIKNWIYNAPAREIKTPDGTLTMQEADMDDVIFVLSLPLRDEYLKLHSNLILKN